eukprot:GFUD01038105.1.p1 GENE.GFUD01038105.1~~GFUD01038105.1.p1  ORF type:complete len:802 (-),score=121.00 GFUD01038105.1:102-2483(-)
MSSFSLKSRMFFSFSELLQPLSSAKSDEDCLKILRKILENNDETLKVAFDFYFEFNQETIIHFMIKNKYTNSCTYIINKNKHLVCDMLNKVDNLHKLTPLILAKQVGSKGVEEVLKSVITEMKVDLTKGTDKNGKIYDLIFKYVEFDFLDITEQIINKIEGKEKMVNPENNQTILMHARSEDMAKLLLDSIGIPTSDRLFDQDSSKRNLAHIYGKYNLERALKRILEEKEAEVIQNLLLQQDKDGNTPLMTAARKAKNKSLMVFLKFYLDNSDKSKVDLMLHIEDHFHKNLTYHVINAPEKVLGPYGVILDFEKDVHMEDNTDEDGYLRAKQCIQKYCGSSMESSLALKNLDSTQTMSSFNLKSRMFFSFLGLLLFPSILYKADVVTDALLDFKYYESWKHPTNITIDCSLENPQESLTLRDYPGCLTAGWKVMYASVFLIVPWIFSALEILRSKHRSCSSLFDKIIIFLLPFSAVVWPIYMKIQSFVCFYRFKTSRKHRLQYHKEFRSVSKTAGLSHLVEVCFESSFQAILQWYLLFPEFLFGLNLFLSNDSEEMGFILLSKASFVFSVLSIAWSFTSFNAVQKDGSIDLAWDPLSRLCLLLSNLLLIFARINCIILFMYYFGPGKFFPGMIAIMVHALVMAVLHHLVVQKQTEKKDGTLLKTLYLCVLNGLANIFSHNFVYFEDDNSSSPNLHIPTFCRQLIFDAVFLVENICFVIFGCLSNIKPLDDPKVMVWIIFIIFGSHFAGLLIKILYYKFLHVWKDLTVSVKKDGLYRGNSKLSNKTQDHQDYEL